MLFKEGVKGTIVIFNDTQKLMIQLNIIMSSTRKTNLDAVNVFRIQELSRSAVRDTKSPQIC